jgi:WD40 repeat protein
MDVFNQLTATELGERNMIFGIRHTFVIAMVILGVGLGRAALGAPFVLTNTISDPTPTSGDFFGGAVAISGNVAVVAATGDDTNGSNTGQVHLFDVNTGTLLRTINNPSPNAIERFGASVAFNGASILIGAPGNDPNGILVGRVHQFDTSGNLLRTYTDLNPTRGDQFGSSVAFSGGNVLIGSNEDQTFNIGGNGNDGLAHLYDATSGALLRTYSNQSPAFGGAFGT